LVPEDHSSDDWTDLAATRAGREVQAKASALRQAAPVRTFLARLLGAHTDERAWRLGGEGEQAVAKQLERLGPGWRILHSIVLSEKGSDLDHLVIGPGGAFCINAKNHPRAAVWVAGATFMVNGQRHPYVRASESEAKKVSRVLTAGCGFDVPVRGVIAVVNANTLTVKQQPGQVRIASRRHLVEWLSSQPHCFSAEKVDSVYSVARRSTTWASKSEPSAPVTAVSDHPISTPANSGVGAMTIGSAVTIGHSFVSGTRLVGDPRPHTALVRAAGFRWSAKQSLWYIPDSPDRPADTVAIDHLAGQLRELGFKVEIDIYR
jgi:hypothetical protein